MRKFDPTYNWYESESPEGKEIEAKLRAAGAVQTKIKDTIETAEAEAAETIAAAKEKAEKIRAKAEADAAAKLKAQLDAEAKAAEKTRAKAEADAAAKK